MANGARLHSPSLSPVTARSARSGALRGGGVPAPPRRALNESGGGGGGWHASPPSSSLAPPPPPPCESRSFRKGECSLELNVISVEITADFISYHCCSKAAPISGLGLHAFILPRFWKSEVQNHLRWLEITVRLCPLKARGERLSLSLSSVWSCCPGTWGLVVPPSTFQAGGIVPCFGSHTTFSCSPSLPLSYKNPCGYI